MPFFPCRILRLNSVLLIVWTEFGSREKARFCDHKKAHFFYRRELEWCVEHARANLGATIRPGTLQTVVIRCVFPTGAVLEWNTWMWSKLREEISITVFNLRIISKFINVMRQNTLHISAMTKGLQWPYCSPFDSRNSMFSPSFISSSVSRSETSDHWRRSSWVSPRLAMTGTLHNYKLVWKHLSWVNQVNRDQPPTRYLQVLRPPTPLGNSQEVLRKWVLRNRAVVLGAKP